MRALVACEESQVVCKAFRERGHEAYSCDLQECSGGHPEWHIQDDVLKFLSGFYKCQCGTIHEEALSKYGCCGLSKFYEWDLIIAFPPCTHLAVSGAAWFAEKRKDGRQQQGIDFFLQFTRLKCKWAIENPVGIMSNIYREPDLIIQPYRFGDPYQKTTCLWLNGLSKLKATHHDAPLFGETVDRGEFITYASGKVMPKWYAEKWGNGHERSKTFPGIARAMAEQWG